MSGYRILYGDIHNHNAHGYGAGSIRRGVNWDCFAHSMGGRETANTATTN
jgi:hypothetical protein